MNKHKKKQIKFEDRKLLDDMYSFFPRNKQEKRRNTIIEELIEEERK